MAEEILNDPFPDLKELESKVGRKTPESLLVWMKDAADCEDGWRSEAVDGGDRGSALRDSFSDKISNLKQEMVKNPIVTWALNAPHFIYIYIYILYVCESFPCVVFVLPACAGASLHVWPQLAQLV